MLTLGSHYENLLTSGMRVIKRLALEQFWQKHPGAQASLEAWYAVVKRALWKNPAELKRVYPNADLVGRRTVFNIVGNKYRLIARVNYQQQRVFVLYLLTHAEYDRGTWKQ